MTSVITLLQFFFLVMRTFQMYSPGSFQMYSTAFQLQSPCSASHPQDLFSDSSKSVCLTTFIHFIHLPNPASGDHLFFSVSTSSDFLSFGFFFLGGAGCSLARSAAYGSSQTRDQTQAAASIYATAAAMPVP